MRDGEYGTCVEMLLHETAHQLIGLEVQRGSRLVHYNNFAAANKSTRQANCTENMKNQNDSQRASNGNKTI